MRTIHLPERSRIKSYTKWSREEDALLTAMLATKASHRDIGVAIGRSENAVSSRVTTRNRPWRDAQRPPQIEYPTATVLKPFVIDWYELGWRVVSIGATDCVMEWRLSRDAEYPGQGEPRAVTPTPDRILEFA